MESMTGFASIEKSTEQFTFSITIKSLNTKFLEVYTNLPKILRDDENEYVQYLKRNFSRGKLEMSIDIYDWTESRPVSVNRKLLENYYREFQKISEMLKIENSFSLDLLLSLDGVIHKGKTSLSGKSRKDIFNSIEFAVKKTIDMRKREGQAIKGDIVDSLTSIANSVKKIKALSKSVSNNLFQRLKESIEKLANSRVDDTRLYTEIAILSDKQDINEEIIRLNDHIKKFKSTIKEKGQIGKKLDFLAQEMFREINTISAKSNSSSISHLVVDVKNYIDKIREQCRNVI